MKIRIFKSIAVIMVMGFMALMQYGCEQEWQKPFESSELKAPTSATVTVSSIEDSTAVISYTASGIGQLYVVVLTGDDEMENPDPNTMLKLTTTDMVYGKQLFLTKDEELSGTLYVSGLEQNTSYKVFALPVNPDAVFGDIATTDAFVTSDAYNPVLKSSSPAAGFVAPDYKVTLTFDEVVVINDTSKIYFSYYDPIEQMYLDKPVKAAVSGKSIVVEQTYEPFPGQYIFLSLDGDAVKDRAGNFYQGIGSGIDGEGKLQGLYWRCNYVTADVTSVAPESGSATSDVNFKIELRYANPMAFNVASVGYDSKDIIVRYIGEGQVVDVEVPQANVSFVDTTVFITLPRTPIYGETITIKVAEGAYRVAGYSSSCAAVDFNEYSWFLSYGYTRDMVLGNYVIGSIVSQWDGALTDTYNVTLSADPDNANQVIVSGMFGSEDSFIAVFDGDFASFDIPVYDGVGQMLTFPTGHPLEAYEFEIWNGYTGYGGVAKGFVNADGSISMVGLGFYYYAIDGTDDGWFDLWPSCVWEPSGGKSAADETVKYVFKSAGIKERIIRK
ncbi:MAG: hypothetical protein AB7E36_12100 [Salinivirgaceae bacterium]